MGSRPARRANGWTPIGGRSSAGADQARRNAQARTAQDRALAAAPGGKKVPATVTAGTEVWGSLAPQCTVRLQLP
jgi:hypothetical protein